MSDSFSARFAALDVLSAVLDQKMFLDQAIDQARSFAQLEGRDRTFVRMLVTTTLRRLGQVDDLIRRASEKGETPSPAIVHHILRLGAAQLAFMNVTDYAAVDTAVTIVEKAGQSRAKGFVNAILRRIAREGKGWLAEQNEVQLNFPSWLRGAWKKDYGADALRDIAMASLTEASLDITLRNAAEAQMWAKKLDAIVLPTGSLRRDAGGDITSYVGFAEGAWWVQDASSALPARLLGKVAGKNVLDMCAAPGGKTAQLASMDAHVTALDQSAPRLLRLAENMERLGFSSHVKTIAADAAQWKGAEKFPFILVDAPCSATGTIRRHPDLLHLKRDVDVPKLAAIQSAILDNAYAHLAPGGVMVYCTCSLQKVEGEEQIDAFLARTPGATRLPVTAAEVGGLEQLITPQGDVRVLPYHLALSGGMDGFFVSRIKRALA